MKKGIHPNYFPEAQVVCACGNTWTTGSTKETIRTEVCSKCHPFFTGQQARMLDIEGQVDRFYRRLQARQEFMDDVKKRETDRVSPNRAVTELELGTRTTDALTKSGLTTVGQILDKMLLGEQALLDIEGFGRKSLIDLKKKLRSLGYELPIPSAAE